jgi:MYXO-CTERM domain-containing protein
VGQRVAVVGLLVASLMELFVTPSAEACSPEPPAPTTAIPKANTTNVSTATSLIVVSALQPLGLKLLANGQDVPLGVATKLGGGFVTSGGRATFWQVQTAADQMLVGGAEHVLSMTASNGSTAELTRFTTAAGYDKTQGTPPVLRSVHLWRVRYPVADIASGNCVFAEYHGFITIDYDPAVVPNTPPGSLVQTIHLAPKNGGSEQAFMYVGETPFKGLEPTGDYPTPIGLWHPELDPTRQYCLSVSAFGDGDIARLPVTSEVICADVVQLSAAGAPPPPQIGGGGTGGGSPVITGGGGTTGGGMASGGGGCGCAVAGTANSPVLLGLLVVALTLGFRRRRR